MPLWHSIGMPFQPLPVCHSASLLTCAVHEVQRLRAERLVDALINASGGPPVQRLPTRESHAAEKRRELASIVRIVAAATCDESACLTLEIAGPRDVYEVHLWRGSIVVSWTPDLTGRGDYWTMHGPLHESDHSIIAAWLAEHEDLIETAERWLREAA